MTLDGIWQAVALQSGRSVEDAQYTAGLGVLAVLVPLVIAAWVALR